MVEDGGGSVMLHSSSLHSDTKYLCSILQHRRTND